MKALLIIAHGSRNKAANDEVCELARRIAAHAGTAFDRVVHAYLEIASPPVDEVITGLAAGGIREIRVFPYFLASGSHVAADVPRMIDEAKAKHPGIRFDILPHVGALEGMVAVILKQLDIPAGAAEDPQNPD